MFKNGLSYKEGPQNWLPPLTMVIFRTANGLSKACRYPAFVAQGLSVIRTRFRMVFSVSPLPPLLTSQPFLSPAQWSVKSIHSNKAAVIKVIDDSISPNCWRVPLSPLNLSLHAALNTTVFSSPSLCNMTLSCSFVYLLSTQ